MVMQRRFFWLGHWWTGWFLLGLLPVFLRREDAALILDRPLIVDPATCEFRFGMEELREEVFQLDGFQCVYCGSRERAALSLDHVVPVSQGGTTVLANLVTACASCNSKKRDRTPVEACMGLYFGRFARLGEHAMYLWWRCRSSREPLFFPSATAWALVRDAVPALMAQARGPKPRLTAKEGMVLLHILYLVAQKLTTTPEDSCPYPWPTDPNPDTALESAEVLVEIALADLAAHMHRPERELRRTLRRICTKGRLFPWMKILPDRIICHKESATAILVSPSPLSQQPCGEEVLSAEQVFGFL